MTQLEGLAKKNPVAPQKTVKICGAMERSSLDSDVLKTASTSEKKEILISERFIWENTLQEDRGQHKDPRAGRRTE